MNRKIITACVSVFFSIQAGAAAWISISEGDVSVYVDAASVVLGDGTVTIWTMRSTSVPLRVFEGGKLEYKSEKMLVLYDCKRRISRDLSAVFYSEEGGIGNVLYSTPSHIIGPVAYVVPDTIGELTFAKACSYLKRK